MEDVALPLVQHPKWRTRHGMHPVFAELAFVLSASFRRVARYSRRDQKRTTRGMSGCVSKPYSSFVPAVSSN